MERGIDPATAEQFRLGVVIDPCTGHEHLAGRLAIPSLGWDGHPYALRFRAIRGEEPKYMGLGGAETRPFNIRAIHQARNIIGITEGEIDAITLEMCGVPAVGITGATNWKRHHPRMFAGFERVYVFGDGDMAGREFTRKVSDSLLSAVGVSLGDGEDVNSLYVKGGKDAVLALIGEA